MHVHVYPRALSHTLRGGGRERARTENVEEENPAANKLSLSLSFSRECIGIILTLFQIAVAAAALAIILTWVAAYEWSAGSFACFAAVR